MKTSQNCRLQSGIASHCNCSHFATLVMFPVRVNTEYTLSTSKIQPTSAVVPYIWRHIYDRTTFLAFRAMAFMKMCSRGSCAARPCPADADVRSLSLQKASSRVVRKWWKHYVGYYIQRVRTEGSDQYIAELSRGVQSQDRGGDGVETTV
jgi:hypothetical protein